MKEILEARKSSAKTSPLLGTHDKGSKASPRSEPTNRVSSVSASTGRQKPVSSDSNTNANVKRSILPSKPRLDGERFGEKRVGEVETFKNIRRTTEQHARLRRGSEDDHGTQKAKDLRKRFDESELLVKELQLEVSTLKADIQRLQSLNVELEAQKKKLADYLSAAEAKILALERLSQTASVGQEGNHSRGNKAVEVVPKVSMNGHLQSTPATVPPPPPPPPPPPARNGSTRESKMQTATALVEFYNSLAERERKRGIKANGSCSTPAASSVHNNIVGELQNRSAHLLAIKADVETKGNFINLLIKKVQDAAYENMEDVLLFVDWLDEELSQLADERAVLKHFNWPERKADALREAAVEYRSAKQLHVEVSSFEDDAYLSCEGLLRKITSLQDRCEHKIQRLIKLRGMVMAAYQECKIPTSWMLDSGMINMVKLATLNLAKFYVKRVLMELDSTRQIEMGSSQESLLFQGVQFAYRIYQFVGRLDSETMRAFEELRSRVQWSQSRELLQEMTLH